MKSQIQSLDRAHFKPQGPTVDHSYLAQVLQPWWNLAASWVPNSISPNMLTIMGTLAVLFPTLAALLYSPELNRPLPAALILAQIIGIFLLQTLDALDGKHARRLQLSSPLGSWLDHTLDIFSMLLVFVGVAASIQSQLSGWTWILLSGVYVAAYGLHWEASHTGVMVLGNGTSITEAQIISMLIHLVALLFPDFWASRLNDYFPIGYNGGIFVQALGVWVISLGITLVGGMAILGSLCRALRALRELKVSGRESLRRILPVVALLLPSTLALLASQEASARLIIGMGTLLLGVRLVGRVVFENLIDAKPSFDPLLYLFTGLSIGLALLPQTKPMLLTYLILCAVPSAVYLTRLALELSRALGLPLLRVPQASKPLE